MGEPAAPAGRSFWWYLEGRAGRAEYWVWFAGLFAVSLALGHVPAISLGLAFGLLVAQIRRLHDFGRSGWWAAAAMTIPTVIGVGVFLVTQDENLAVLIASPIQLVLIAAIGAVAGDKAANRFGPVPPFTVKRVLTGR